MKILAADDQPMILRSIDHKLKNEGFDIHFANDGLNAIEKFDQVEPDLMILDLKMPNMSGFEVLESIRKQRQSDVPIIVMSGEAAEDAIVQAFKAGADDYIQKPVGLNELLIRIQKLLKQPLLLNNNYQPNQEVQRIQKDLVGVVIPCYNEENRINSQKFLDFANSNLGYHLCFVNDGSKDKTLEVLTALASKNPDHISVFDCEKNGGKAEAVRQGILHLSKDTQLDYFGYLDADLSTDFRDFDDLVQTISTGNYQIVGGSRMARMGADITKEDSRAIISKSVNLIIRRILGMPFNDTQCGAKVMTREVAENMFEKPFLTSWLFDVEIFLRMKKFYGDKQATAQICEQPLKRWIHEDGSHLSMKDSIKIVGQLGQLAIHYR